MLQVVIIMQLEIVSLSKVGGREVNEDACDSVSLTAGMSCCILSDGLGGHYGGEVASKLAVQHVLDGFCETPDCSAQAIETLLHIADDAIVQAQQQDEKLKHMRATAVVLTVDTNCHQAYWGHIGDSRLYCFRQSRIVNQTRDHSITQSMIDAGYLKSEELRTSPDRSKLYAALGNNEQFEVDILSTAFSIQDGDVFLLCSDGLWEYIEEREMEQMLSQSTSAQEWLRALEEQVLARGHEGQDNYSAVIVWCRESDETTQRYRGR